MNENSIEKEIINKGKVLPRITPACVDADIVKADYYVFPNTTVTVCCLTLQNGYNVLGESACVVPENFDVEIGRKIAFENARNKIWTLLGYSLKQRLFETKE